MTFPFSGGRLLGVHERRRSWAVVALFLVLAACGTGKKPVQIQLSEEFSYIEGRLAGEPFLSRNTKRLNLYLGDLHVEEEAPIPDPPLTNIEGEEVEVPEPVPPERSQPKLTNIRKAITQNLEERWVLDDLLLILKAMKRGPEGPVIRLYGKHTRGTRVFEQMGSIDFFFCFLSYEDPITGQDTPIDTCYGDRWKDGLLDLIKSKGAAGLKKGIKLVIP